MKTKACKTRP